MIVTYFQKLLAVYHILIETALNKIVLTLPKMLVNLFCRNCTKNSPIFSTLLKPYQYTLYSTLIIYFFILSKC